MSLKELTAEKHKLAETTPFMKAIFDHRLPIYGSTLPIKSIYGTKKLN